MCGSSKPYSRPKRPSTPVSLEHASVCTGTPSARTFASWPRQASSRHDARSAPARGRPRVLYEAAAEPLDERALASYRLLVQILASHLAGSERNPSARAEEAGRLWGAQLVRRPPPSTTISKEETINQVVRLHQQYGFRPQLRQAKNGQEIVLKRCPFQELATTYQTVICPVHLGLMRGALAELRTGIETDWLKPFAEPGACVAHLTGA